MARRWIAGATDEYVEELKRHEIQEGRNGNDETWTGLLCAHAIPSGLLTDSVSQEYHNHSSARGMIWGMDGAELSGHNLLRLSK
ncbi:hypothetical protein M0657_006342 [Pyricularia oryzae]|uniref:Uncharacterized protein n=1 Tax=Pyricularia oryzae TaxID=318829 RepID=A0A4P7NUT2_PYROR|nr:hypothetical protein M9X92_008812 [Pyricularia oryzae]KAI7920967.1 hypothetical protein M0657_006342 [Pyricularia oryzae]QBZ66345.1 hypothetical protein PoMZ_13320 [Pyricularia oryzae]